VVCLGAVPQLDIVLRHGWISAATRRYIPEYRTFRDHRCGNLKSYRVIISPGDGNKCSFRNVGFENIQN
jgi:hypothetical protein